MIIHLFDIIRMLNKNVSILLYYMLLLFRNRNGLKIVSNQEKISNFGICMLVCHQHVPLLILNIGSFINVSGFFPNLFLISDGSLTKNDIRIIEKLFRRVVIISKSQADRRTKLILNDYKNFRLFRFSHLAKVTKYKLDLAILNPFKKYMIVDPDTLWHRYPEEVVKWINSKQNYNLYQLFDPILLSRGDISDDVQLINLFGLFLSVKSFDGLVSTYLGLSEPMSSKQLEFLDQYFMILHKIAGDSSWFAEERAFSFVLRKLKRPVMKLSFKKYVNIFEKKHLSKYDRHEVVACHYAGKSKNLMYIHSVLILFNSLRKRIEIN